MNEANGLQTALQPPPAAHCLQNSPAAHCRLPSSQQEYAATQLLRWNDQFIIT